MSNNTVVYASTLSSHLRVAKVKKSKGLSLESAAEKEFKKYYGKKVTKLIFDDYSSSRFPFPLQRCKVVKSFIMNSPHQKKPLPRSLKSFEISYWNFDYKDEILSNMLRRIGNYKYKGLEALKIGIQGRLFNFTPSFFKQVRTLNHLQSLELWITQQQLLQNSSQFLATGQLKTLKTLRLKVYETMQSAEPSAALDFYTKLIKSKTLRYLKLDLTALTHAICENEVLLQAISKTTLPSLHILLTMNDRRPIPNRDLNAALLKVDQLTLLSCNNRFMKLTCNTTKSYDISLCQVKRKLHFDMVTDNTPEETASEPLKNAKELLSKFQMSSIPAKLSLRNAENLKTLSLDMQVLPPNALELEVAKKLVQTLKEERDLEHLGLNRCIIIYDAKAAVYEPIFAEIARLQNLQVLNMPEITLAHDFLEIVAKPLRSLVNLRKLIFGMGYTDSLDVDLGTLFPTPCKLTDLYITLPKLNLSSKIKFIKAVSKLSGLQKLILQEGTEILDEDTPRALLIEALLGLANLKEVLIFMNPFRPERNGTFGIKTSSSSKTGPAEDKQIVEDLKHYVNKLFEKNRNLLKVEFLKSDAYNIKYEIY